MKKLPFVHALATIVGSLLIIPGTFYKGYHIYWSQQIDASHYLCRIVQTGPQREALKTTYLAELLQLCANQPITYHQFNRHLAQKRICSSPVIKEAKIKVIKPDTVYVDYTVRQPVAWLYDFNNIALDDEGVPFPIAPFFTPKKLPEIYLGLKDFAWNQPLKGALPELALTLLHMMNHRSLHIQRIDVTQALAPSLGKREIVVILEESGFSKFLRLTPKNYAQEVGNYLELRKALPPEPQVIDLRIPQLAFIDTR